MAQQGVLAAYVSPVHGASGPTVLGLRALALADPRAELDVTVPLSALGDRFAAADSGNSDSTELAVPPMRATDAGWAGVSPPRGGWELRTALDPAELTAAARAGVEEIAAALPDAVGAHVVAQVRAQRVGPRAADRARRSPRVRRSRPTRSASSTRRSRSPSARPDRGGG